MLGMRLQHLAPSPAELPANIAALVDGLPRLMTLEEVASVTRLSPRAVRYQISRGLLRATRAIPGSPSSRVLVTRDALAAYLAKCEASYRAAP
jgi:hypothetical protein